jgi:hypothetical protein
LLGLEAEVEEHFFAGVEDVVGDFLEVAALEDEFEADAVDLAAAPVVAELVGPMREVAGDAGVFAGDVAGAAFDLLQLAGLAMSLRRSQAVLLTGAKNQSSWTSSRAASRVGWPPCRTELMRLASASWDQSGIWVLSGVIKSGE